MKNCSALQYLTLKETPVPFTEAKLSTEEEFAITTSNSYPLILP